MTRFEKNKFRPFYNLRLAKVSHDTCLIFFFLAKAPLPENGRKKKDKKKLLST